MRPAHEVTMPSLLTIFTTRSFLEDAVRTAHPASWTESSTSSIRARAPKSLKRLPGPLGVGRQLHESGWLFKLAIQGGLGEVHVICYPHSSGRSS